MDEIKLFKFFLTELNKQSKLHDISIGNIVALNKRLNAWIFEKMYCIEEKKSIESFLKAYVDVILLDTRKLTKSYIKQLHSRKENIRKSKVVSAEKKTVSYIAKKKKPIVRKKKSSNAE